MKIISFDSGKTYFADKIEKNEITRAVEIDGFNKNAIIKYFKSVNLNECLNIQVSDNTGYTINEFTEEQQNEFRRIEEIFNEAVQKAGAYTVNSVFEKLVSKYGK